MSFTILTDEEIRLGVTDDGGGGFALHIRTLIGFSGSSAGEILANVLSKSICSILSGS